MSRTVLRTMPGMSIQHSVEISPATSTTPVVTRVSQATLPMGSSAMIASRTASEIWSASLSGCPSVTDSEVNRYRRAIRRILAAGRRRGHQFRHSVEDGPGQLTFRPRPKGDVVAGGREQHRVVGLRAEAGPLSPHLVHDDEIELLLLELAPSR